jgi:hypothetical protein
MDGATEEALQAVLGSRDIFVRIRSPGSVTLTNGPRSGSNSRFDLFGPIYFKDAVRLTHL